MGTPLFSVVICTHNRVAYLEKALAGVFKQEFPADRFEVLVVDNGSSDSTSELVQRCQGQRHKVRYISEPELGLSNARNTGWRKASGQFIAYLDDDAIPDAAWLKNAADELGKGRRDLGILGGKVEPIWEAERPNWLNDHLVGFLSMVDLGPDARYVDEDNGIVGANMIIPRKLLDQYGGFNSCVGRVGNSLISSEELLLKRKLSAFNYRGFYRPDVRVRHHASAERLTREWFLRRFYWQGRSDAILTQLEQPGAHIRRVMRRWIEHGKGAILFVASILMPWHAELRFRAAGHRGRADGYAIRAAGSED